MSVCLLILVGSREPLPYREWIPPDDVIGAGEGSAGLVSPGVFTVPHVYSFGTRHTGCGCGFQGDYPQARQARAALASFLDRALARVPELQLFVAWAGTEGVSTTPTSYGWVGPSDIRTWRTDFVPGELLQIVRES